MEGEPVADVEEAVSYQEVVRLFAELPKIYRFVLEMRLLLGYSGKIAKCLGLTENAVNGVVPYTAGPYEPKEGIEERMPFLK